MERLFVIDRDLFAWLDVAQSKEHHVSMDCAHIGVRLAGMVDVMRAVAAATAVDTPDAVNIADAQLGAMGAALGFAIRNSLTRVFGDLLPVRKGNRGKATSAVDGRFLNRETGCKFQRHRKF